MGDNDQRAKDDAEHDRQVSEWEESMKRSASIAAKHRQMLDRWEKLMDRQDKLFDLLEQMARKKQLGV